MSDSIQTTLLALKDVKGIQGSFVLNGQGALLAMEMPALFDASMFAELGPRIERLGECFSALGDELESCMVRFSDHMLCIKQFPESGALCILTTGTVNLPALKMAINLAHRRLADQVAAAQPVPVPPSAPPVATPAAASASPATTQNGQATTVAPEDGVDFQPSEKKKAYYYRGHLVQD
jgi:predicted regulator of Ras-like GTPase activity (Roadblock/LC7/MglB family)